jgi:hypothetical protein
MHPFLWLLGERKYLQKNLADFDAVPLSVHLTCRLRAPAKRSFPDVFGSVLLRTHNLASLDSCYHNIQSRFRLSEELKL